MFKLNLSNDYKELKPINFWLFIDALMMTKIEVEYDDDSTEIFDAEKKLFDFFSSYQYFANIDHLKDLHEDDYICSPNGHYFVKKSAIKFKIKDKIKNVIYLFKK